jgi:hypothetical protein
MKLHAIPVYEFYDNAARYGPQFAGIPYFLSKSVVISLPDLVQVAEGLETPLTSCRRYDFPAHPTAHDENEAHVYSRL